MKIEDAIKRYESWAEDDRIDVLIRKEHKQMADWLKELKADRPQGEWIEMYRNGFGNMICMCSKCSFHATKSNFCPNCGADMRGKDDETNH